MSEEPTIFVSVAAYMEPLLQFTLDSMFTRASKPERIFVGLFDQSHMYTRGWLSKKNYDSNVRYLQIDPVESRGASWARSVCNTLYMGEDYFLQIDSHTWFDKGWDMKLLRLMDAAEKKSRKPIISTYPPPFSFTDEGKPFKNGVVQDAVFVLRPLPDANPRDEKASFGFGSVYVKGPVMCVGYHIAGGFVFAPGNFVEEIPYDYRMYFEGEEQNISVRAFTHGWDIFHVRDTFIPLYHLYKENGEDYVNHHWHESIDSKRKTKWPELTERSDKRLRELVFDRKTGGAYGLGTVRSMDEYERRSGIEYSKRQIKGRVGDERSEDTTGDQAGAGPEG